ncbi:phage portal protein [Porphyromonas sp. oral taxon 278]|uniref:phage portal protein n=1 Tax=Porphyromonas sp. oral taxon 278 TaxID=712437 RepID=UPI0025CDECC7|nr:phage portal protein [Porphyromonas sp. oral taxon 278]
MNTTVEKEMGLDERIARIRSKYDDRRYAELLSQWDYKSHEVHDETIRKKNKVLVNEEEAGANGGAKSKRKRYEYQEVNRISTPIERIIVNTHTSFAVGLDPDLQAAPKTDVQRYMLEIIRATEKKNKIRNVNRRVVRSVLSETMVAEYWWSVEDAEFYEDMPYAGGAKTRLRCEVWSPFRGDKLVPVLDHLGDLKAFYRFYSVKDDEGKVIDRLMEIDNVKVTTYEKRRDGWEILRSATHGFGKIPVIYMQTEEAICECIQSKRKRIEMLQSNFGDCIDDNFAPKVLVRGNMTGLQKTGKTQVLQMNGDADVRYLTWDQSTAAAEGELERLVNECYSMTLTPPMSPKDLQGLGSALSGVAFKYVFMGAHIAVRDNEEFIGEYLARRYSFLKHAIALQVPSVSGGRGLSLDPVLVPFTIEESTGTSSKDDKPDRGQVD